MSRWPVWAAARRTKGAIHISLGRKGPSTFPWYRRVGGPIQSLVPESGWPHPIPSSSPPDTDCPLPRSDRASGRCRCGAGRAPTQRGLAAKRIGQHWSQLSASDVGIIMRNRTAPGLTATKIFDGNSVSLRHRGGRLKRKGQKTKGLDCDLTISWDGPLPGTPRLLAGLPLAVR